MRLLLVILLLFGVAEGMPVAFQPAGTTAAHVDVPCDGDELPPLVSTWIALRDEPVMQVVDRVLVGRLPERPLLRPPIG